MCCIRFWFVRRNFNEGCCVLKRVYFLLVKRRKNFVWCVIKLIWIRDDGWEIRLSIWLSKIRDLRDLDCFSRKRYVV